MGLVALKASVVQGARKASLAPQGATGRSSRRRRAFRSSFPAHAPGPHARARRYSFAGWQFVTVDVDGPMNGPSLLSACAAKGLRTPCDHPAYCDGKCVVVDYTGHLSYNNDGRRPRDLWQGKYFYAANANQGYTLQSVDNSHRWSDPGNEYGPAPSISINTAFLYQMTLLLQVRPDPVRQTPRPRHQARQVRSPPRAAASAPA